MTLQKYPYNHPLDDFSIIGINYRKSDTTIRGNFSLSEQKASELLKLSVSRRIPGCFVLSTCNRTEVYALCNEADVLTELLCKCTNGDREQLSMHQYTYRGLHAVHHLFKVAAGLDSQIIGDNQIFSQLKLAVKNARSHQTLNGLIERIVNYALQASKEIKTKTKLSSGTVSVSYAAIKIIKEKFETTSGKNILLVGTGKLGNNIAGNLKKYFPDTTVSIINRTDEKAHELADKYHFNFIHYSQLGFACNDADIVIVNSAAPDYIIFSNFFSSRKTRLVLDLSIPANVDPEVGRVPGITLLNVDEVSLMLEETFSIRRAEIPKAYTIVDQTIRELEEWHRQYSIRHAG